VQADLNWRQVEALVDGAGLRRRRLTGVKDGALADAHAQQVAHQFHDPSLRAVSDQINAHRQLAQPRPGNRQLEQHFVVCRQVRLTRRRRPKRR